MAALPADAHSPRANAYTMVSIEEACAEILRHTEPIKVMQMALSSACLGRILAEDVKSPEAQPPFRASIKDGYAVRAAEGTGVFPVSAAARASSSASGMVLPERSVGYITTGAPLPEGADAVVQVENTSREPNGPDGSQQVRINIAATRAGEDVRAVGSDVALGELVLQRGELLGPAELAILASCGCGTVAVHGTPKCAVLSTGNELTPHDAPAPLPWGAVRDSNRPMLLAACVEAGAETLDLGIAGDDADRLEAALDAAIAAGCDVLLTSGGVSMGDRDLVKPLLEARGQVHFGRVLMKPGKPLTFATVSSPPSSSSSSSSSTPSRPLLVFGLPGNPVSSLVTFQLCVVPCLRRLAGWPCPQLRRVHVRLAQALRLDPARPEFHRATLEVSGASGMLEAHTTGGQISSRLLSFRGASALLELPVGSGVLPKGTLVSALLVGSLGSSASLVSAAKIVPSVAPEDAPSAGPAGAPLVCVLTISDRASAGVYADESGPALMEVLREYITSPFTPLLQCIPDDQATIESALLALASRGACLVVTTGGTGPSGRDVTPEAMARICSKTYPGFGESMRAASLAAGVPTAILSRQSAGSLGKTLIVNMPGKPAAVRVCLEAVFPAIPYCVELLGGPVIEGKGAFRPKAK